MSAPRSLWQLSAAEQVSLVLSGAITRRDLVAAHLSRIESVNRTVGAVTRTLADAALAEAEAADRNGARRLLEGLPFTVKEDIDCFGSPTTRGVAAMRHALPFVDAPIVTRMKAAGAIPIGRCNLSEMGLRLCTNNPLHGRTLNPHDRRLSAGGSSGGDAVAVATGMTPVGLGGDLGGSLRVPAACCGCVALKPTTGRIPWASSLPPRDLGLAMQLMFSPGPLVRAVTDLRLLLPVLAGRDARDPRSVDVPLEGPMPDELTAALVTSLPGAPLEASTVDAIRRAGKALEDAGWQVEEARPPTLERVYDVFSNLLAAEIEFLAGQVQRFVSDALNEHLARLCQANVRRRMSSHRLHAERSALIRDWSGFFASYAVVIGPTLARPIWPIDADLDPANGIALVEQATRFIVPGNALGIPSLAVPMGLVDGLPTGVLVYADLWREDLCMRAAEIIEAVSGRLEPIDPQG